MDLPYRKKFGRSLLLAKNLANYTSNPVFSLNERNRSNKMKIIKEDSHGKKCVHVVYQQEDGDDHIEERIVELVNEIIHDVDKSGWQVLALTVMLTKMKKYLQCLGLRLIIIVNDKQRNMSMISNVTFAMIHCILRHCFGNNVDPHFGNKNIVLLVDLLQLSPDNDQFLFEQISIEILVSRFSCKSLAMT
uniref:Uncharacterized protein n=1 Tax=Romanomermis culicivorax TaxID=13658 RepID=A0A915JUR5_ROMCU